MTIRTQTWFACAQCDSQYLKWVGRCEQCGKWGTVAPHAPHADSLGTIASSQGAPLTVTRLSETTTHTLARISTGIGEADRVWGGGIVPGSVSILGGEPGIGKSTLVLQIAAHIGRNNRVLYVSGEESGAQVHMRATRMGLTQEGIDFLTDTRVEHICATIATLKPSLAIIDSIHTMESIETEGIYGGMTQVKAAAAQLVACAKTSGIPLLLIGHVTKDGGVAGPKTLEHLVDAVFLLEGDRSGHVRILRGIKNRFGPVCEMGVFTMVSHGLQEVTNPSELFLAERSYTVPGTVVTPLMEGTRPLLVEVQALTTRAAFGIPQRKASGFDTTRLQILLAVLTRRMGLPLDTYDVFVNISGGVEVDDRSVDLALALAILSALQDTTISKDIIAFGEIGLGGEVRSVSNFEPRIKEAQRLGFTYALVPHKHTTITTSMKIAPVLNVRELVEKFVK